MKPYLAVYIIGYIISFHDYCTHDLAIRNKTNVPINFIASFVWPYTILQSIYHKIRWMNF